MCIRDSGNLPRLWFLLGSEPLLAIEAQDAIRAAAFKAGYSERKSFVFEGNADYSPLYEALGDQSLFGEKNLIEVVFPRATIGKNGPAAVEAVIEHADEDKMVVVSLFDYDWTATKKDWFNHLMKSSVCIRTDPIDRNALPRWITERAKEKNGQTLTPEAANLIAERTEGNLLATSQEIQKLALLVNKPEIDASDVLDAVSDVSRFDQESLFLAMLEGDARQVSKIIDSLQGENVQIPSFLWMLTDVVRNLLLLNRGFAVRTFGLSEACLLYTSPTEENVGSTRANSISFMTPRAESRRSLQRKTVCPSNLAASKRCPSRRTTLWNRLPSSASSVPTLPARS